MLHSVKKDRNGILVVKKKNWNGIPVRSGPNRSLTVTSQTLSCLLMFVLLLLAWWLICAGACSRVAVVYCDLTLCGSVNRWTPMF